MWFLNYKTGINTLTDHWTNVLTTVAMVIQNLVSRPFMWTPSHNWRITDWKIFSHISWKVKPQSFLQKSYFCTNELLTKPLPPDGQTKVMTPCKLWDSCLPFSSCLTRPKLTYLKASSIPLLKVKKKQVTWGYFFLLPAKNNLQPRISRLENFRYMSVYIICIFILIFVLLSATLDKQHLNFHKLTCPTRAP